MRAVQDRRAEARQVADDRPGGHGRAGQAVNDAAGNGAREPGMSDHKDTESCNNSVVNWRALTQAQVLRALNLSPHTILAWEANNCPVKIIEGKKTYDLRAILDWRVKFRRDPEAESDPDLGDGKRSSAGGELVDAGLLEYRKHRAEMARLDVEERKKHLVQRDLVDQLARNEADYVRAGLQGLARKIGESVLAAAKEGNQAEVERIITEEHNAVLRRLSEMHRAD